MVTEREIEKQQQFNRDFDATKRGYAIIYWTSACLVSRNRNAFAALVRTLPSDTTIEYFKSQDASELLKDWHQGVKLILRSREFTGTLDKPQVLSVETAPRVVVHDTDNVK